MVLSLRPNKKILLSFLFFISSFCYSMDVQEDLTCVFHTKSKKSTNVLGPEFLKFAREKHKTLKSDDPDCFKSSFIKNQQKAMRKLKELGGKSFKISYGNQKYVHCTFFDRNSDTLLVLGGGFPVQRQRMLPFVKLFPKYDLLLFDYRGIGSDHAIGASSYFLPWKWKGWLSWSIAKVDFNVSGLGALEEADVIAAVDFFKNRKEYKKTFGLGLCFSTYVFAKIAASQPRFFDKLIFDGSWPSIERVVKTIIKYPSLTSSVENPRSPAAFVTDSEYLQSFMVKLLEWIAWVDIKTLPMADYLSKIKVPILFFQSLNDCYCNEKEFDEIWKAVESDKMAVFTKNRHGRNHVWQAEAYKEIAHEFFKSNT